MGYLSKIQVIERANRTRQFYLICPPQVNGGRVMENESPGMGVEVQDQPALAPEMHLWLRPEKEKTADQLPVRVKAVQRDQLLMRTLDVEHLVGPDHPARAIWEVVGARDLQPFYEKIKAVETKAGRPPHDPHLLISV